MKTSDGKQGKTISNVSLNESEEALSNIMLLSRKK